MDWMPTGMNSLGNAGVATSNLKSLAGEIKTPEAEVPAVGDTMRVVAHPWGSYEVYREGMVPNGHSKIIEVEVKAIKSVKVIFE